MKAPTSALCLCLCARARARLRARMSCHSGRRPSRRKRLGFHPSPAFRKRLSCPVGRPKRSRTALLLLRTGLAQGSPSRARRGSPSRAPARSLSPRTTVAAAAPREARGAMRAGHSIFIGVGGLAGPGLLGAGGSSSSLCARRCEAYLRFAGTRRRRRARRRRRRRRRNVKMLPHTQRKDGPHNVKM